MCCTCFVSVWCFQNLPLGRRNCARAFPSTKSSGKLSCCNTRSLISATSNPRPCNHKYQSSSGVSLRIELQLQQLVSKFETALLSPATWSNDSAYPSGLSGNTQRHGRADRLPSEQATESNPCPGYAALHAVLAVTGKVMAFAPQQTKLRQSGQAIRHR
jgi:hypothetical protein